MSIYKIDLPDEEHCSRISVEQCADCWEVVLWYGDEAVSDTFYCKKSDAIKSARRQFNDEPTAKELTVGMAKDFGRQHKVLRSR
jgi:hypothetical protein